MLRSSYRILARLLPRTAHMLRESAYTLSGWRFDDLKTFIAQQNGDGRETPSLPLEFTLHAALDAEREAGRIAFISCLPPQETGIATCSLYSWLGFKGAIDYFGPVTDIDWFFSLRRLLAGDGDGPRLYDVGGFLSMDSARRYDDIVIAVGNSNHHLYIFDVLRKLASFGSLSRVTFHIHDPCLLNLVQRGAGLSAPQLGVAMSRIYQRKLPMALEDGRAHAALVEQGVLGLRYFVDAGITRFLVNSTAAQQLVAEDLRGTPATVGRIFHPAFLPLGAPADETPALRPDRLVIGVYGAPAHGKGLETITDAVRLLNQRGQPASLIVAGFGARRYAERYSHLFREIEVDLFDGPADTQLVRCMQRCHVAVQLRARNLGESSGIVPQLLCLGKDVIVSAVGAFMEFGEAVRAVDPDATAVELAAQIIELRRNPIAAGLKREYVEKHSPAEFQRRFLEIFLPQLRDARLELVAGR